MKRPFKDFVIVDKFLFNGNLLVIPICSLCFEHLYELHRRNLSGHFQRNKTLSLVQANFFWPKLEKRCG